MHRIRPKYEFIDNRNVTKKVMKQKVMDVEGERIDISALKPLLCCTTGDKKFDRRLKAYYYGRTKVSAAHIRNLGVLYHNGSSPVPKDKFLSREYIAMATLKGDAMAMRIFGDYWRTGYGCKKNHLMAKMCYEDSVNHGNEKARKRLKKYYSKGE